MVFVEFFGLDWVFFSSNAQLYFGHLGGAFDAISWF
jgi:hypothetical protein